jgi:hypothetical protein
MRFPDIEDALVVLLEPLAGGEDHTGTETPANLQDVLPFIRVVRTGGFSDQVNDYATVDIDTFDATYRTGVKPLAERVRQFLTGQTHRVGGVVLDRITCPNAPAELPWAPGMRRMGATYTVVSRRYLAAS